MFQVNVNISLGTHCKYSWISPNEIVKRSLSIIYNNTAENIPEYGVSLTPIFPYKDKIVDPVLIRENTGQRTPVR